MRTDPVPTYVEPADGGSQTTAEHLDASLTFRLGLVDTGYAQHGEVHVLSRLALGALDGYDVASGVTVATMTTRFDVSGTASEVLGALDALTGWVCAPSWSAIDDVVARVRLEGRDGVDGVDEQLALAVLARWGRDGVGLLGCAPHCGYAAAVDRLDHWRATHLTSGNAVLSGVGTALEGVRLELPPGPRMPAPKDRALPQALPAWRRTPGLGGSAVLTTLTGDATTTRVMSTLLTRALDEAPVAGRPASRTRALPVGDGLLWLYTHGVGASALVLATLDRMAEGEVSDEEVEDARGAVPPAGPGARAASAALAELLGTGALRPTEEMTRDELVAEARAARDHLLLLTAEPPGTGLGETPPRPLAGTGEVLHRYHGRRSRDELVITDTTCERTTAGGVEQVEGVAWDQLVGVHRVEHDVRRLVPRDGAELWIDSHDWRHGRHALGMVDGHVDDDLVIHEPDPYDELHADRRPWQDPALLALLGVGLAVLVVLVLLAVWVAT